LHESFYVSTVTHYAVKGPVSKRTNMQTAAITDTQSLSTAEPNASPGSSNAPGAQLLNIYPTLQNPYSATLRDPIHVPHIPEVHDTTADIPPQEGSHPNTTSGVVDPVAPAVTSEDAPLGGIDQAGPSFPIGQGISTRNAYNPAEFTWAVAVARWMRLAQPKLSLSKLNSRLHIARLQPGSVCYPNNT